MTEYAGYWTSGCLAAASLAALFYFERGPEVRSRRKKPKPQIAVSIHFFLIALFLLVFGDLSRSLMTALYIVVLIGAASKTKARYTKFNLVFEDLLHLRDGAADFVSSAYIGVVASAAVIVVAATSLLALGFISLPAVYFSWPARAVVFIAAGAMMIFAFRSIDWRQFYNIFALTANHSHISGFFVSAFLADRPQSRFEFVNGFGEPLPLPSIVRPEPLVLPHVFIIQHESTFDPRIYDIPIGAHVKSFLKPKDAIAGSLNVDVFGGHSWMTEFAFLTGVSALSFGGGSRYIYYAANGKVRHALPRHLKSLGYQTAMMTPTSSNFLNYDSFYESAGVDDRIFMAERGSPFDHPDLRLHSSDQLFFEAALQTFEEGLAATPGPSMMMMLTNFNHGPHTRRRLKHQLSRRSRDFAHKFFPDPQYGEYYARMSFTAKAYSNFVAGVRARITDRPVLIIRYGDHQPLMARNILKIRGLAETDPRAQRTFYSVEGLNLDLTRPEEPLPEPLDIAFLATAALRAGGLPMPPILALQETLMKECGSAYHDTRSALKDRYHGTLVAEGLMDARAP